MHLNPKLNTVLLYLFDENRGTLIKTILNKIVFIVHILVKITRCNFNPQINLVL
jgi:hypothetical protein